uniref:Uncharacterized protein n=1 Tax=Oryza nivara TaxID=4536 RepID=A0A0E0HN19_ORYNI
MARLAAPAIALVMVAYCAALWAAELVGSTAGIFLPDSGAVALLLTVAVLFFLAVALLQLQVAATGGDDDDAPSSVRVQCSRNHRGNVAVRRLAVVIYLHGYGRSLHYCRAVHGRVPVYVFFLHHEVHA